MMRKPGRAHKNPTRRAEPRLENLEQRQLLSHAPLRHTMLRPAAATKGSLSTDHRQFTYVTPSGGTAQIKVVGRGNLTGTSLDSAGDLQLEFAGTNAYSKITGSVHGGDGRAPLASILPTPSGDPGATKSLTGVGSPVLESVLLGSFDLIPDGNINLTAGVNSLSLDSIGPDTQIHLRALPPAPTTTTSTSGVATIVNINTVSGTRAAVITPFGTTTSTTTSSDSTLEAGQSATVSSPYGSTTTYVSTTSGAQILTAVSGGFTSAGNIVESLPAGQPTQTPPPAPPGIIVKANRIDGTLTAPVNLLTDSKIFGYDPTTGDLIRFNLDLTNDTGVVDPTFTPIAIPGEPAVAGVNLATDGTKLAVLVSSGTTVYAYNATTGAPLGSFTSPVPINSIGSTDRITALGSYQTNELQLINLPASLQTGVVQPAPGDPKPFVPTAGFTLLGGFTGVPGSDALFSSVAAHFDTFQPSQTQLGIQSVNTVQVSTHGEKGASLSFQFSSLAQTAVTQHGAYINVQPDPLLTSQPGPALGSVDQSLAGVIGLANGANTVAFEYGTITLQYPDLLVGLSESFRTDLTDSALIDIQGSVQSIRGRQASGMVLNDTGNLNLVKFAQVANSTIVGQPVGHVQIASRSNVTILSSRRAVGDRNGVTVDSSLHPIGPLSQTGD
jgi:hypothetical protein